MNKKSKYIIEDVDNGQVFSIKGEVLAKGITLKLDKKRSSLLYKIKQN